MQILAKERGKMKKKSKKILSLVLTLAVSFTMVFGSAGFAQAASYSKTKAAFEKCGDYIYNTVNKPIVGSIGGEWVMYGLGHAGYAMSDEYVESYRETLIAALDEGYCGQKGILHDKKFTEYERVIVACSALGIDATDVGGYNIVEALADFVNVKWREINSVAWALIALDSGNYDVPKLTDSYPYGTLSPEETDRQNSRERMIEYILGQQYDDGGWNLSEKGTATTANASASDIDVTGMVMISLAPYISQPKVKKALDRAVNLLSERQNSDGGYESWGTANSESCAQVICALLACGINPNTNSKFIKNGKTPIDALMSFYDEEVGGFCHVNEASGGYEPTVNQMATEQAYYALAFFYKYVPTQVSAPSLTKAASGKLKISWKKAQIDTDYATLKSGKTADVSGYQIVCATNKSFTKGKVTKTVSAKTLSKTITGLTKGKTYYVKVRAYKTVNGKKIYGLYSSVKSKKV